MIQAEESALLPGKIRAVKTIITDLSPEELAQLSGEASRSGDLTPLLKESLRLARFEARSDSQQFRSDAIGRNN
jgi:hypothetical protein